MDGEVLPDGNWPGAALVKVDAGAPGRPLK